MSARTTALVTLAALVGSAAAHCNCDALAPAKKFACLDAKAADAAACTAVGGEYTDDASGTPDASQSCSPKAVRQLCKAAFNEELDCTTETKLADGKQCTNCSDDWCDKSGCQVTCLLMSATFGEATPAKVSEMKSKCAEANEDRTGPADTPEKKSAFQKLLDAWDTNKGGSTQATNAAQELGTGAYAFKQMLRKK